MKYFKRIFLVFVSSTVFFAGIVTTSVSAKPTNLIDEQLNHFQNVYPYGTAIVKNGVLELSSIDNFFLLTKQTYQDFILRADVKMPNVDEYHNSGIIFRAQLRATKDGYYEAIGYQAEVDPSDRKWSGGLYDQGRREWLHPTHPTRSHPDEHFFKNVSKQWSTQHSQAYKPLEWNQYRIEARGSNIKIYVNDVLTTHVIDTKDAGGFIGFQHHGSKQLLETGDTDNVVYFKNVTVQELNL